MVWKKIAIGGGLAIASVLAIAYIAAKTNILERVRSGLASTGMAIGQGVGAGLASIPIGIGQGGANVLQQGAGQLGTAWQGFLDWLQGKPTSPPAIPNFGLAYGEPTQDNLTLTPTTREYSDASPPVPFFALPRAGSTIKSISISGGKITSVTRHVSTKAAVAASSPARQASFARTKARAMATARARKKGRKCFNSELNMGGVQHILNREDFREVGYDGL